MNMNDSGNGNDSDYDKEPTGPRLPPQRHVDQRREAWKTADEIRFEYDTNIPAIDRLFQAVADFQATRGLDYRNRKEGKLWHIWVQFLLFVGLLSDTPRHRGSTNSSDHNRNHHGRGRGRHHHTTPRFRPNPEHPYKFLFSERSDTPASTLEAAAVAAADNRIARLWAFISDSEMAVQKFLSWGLFDAGSISIYHEPNLHITPWIISAFLDFLLRNRVLADPDPEAEGGYEGALRRARGVAGRAMRELPLTYRLNQALPDAFSEWCAECWGTRTGTGMGMGGQNVAEGYLGGDELVNGWCKADTSGWDMTKEREQEQEQEGKEGRREWVRGLLLDALLTTHTTGVVERSMRRIKTVTPPAAPSPSPDAIALEDLFAKVVLEPWLDWDTTHRRDLSSPTICTPPSSTVPHDPRTDDITLLVEPALLDDLCMGVGMGIGATWTRILRCAGDGGGAGSGEVGADVDTGYWYMEHLSEVLPGYYRQVVEGEALCAGLFEVV